MKLLTIFKERGRKVTLKIKKNFNRKNLKAIVKKVGTVSLISKIIVFSVLMATIPAGVIKADTQKNVISPYNTSIVLDTSKPQPLVIPENPKPVITLGESEYQKREREEREKILAVSSRKVIARERINYDSTPYDADLTTKRTLAKRAASAYGIDWKILEAVWQVESGKAWITPVRSYAGAQGPMQFLSGTWNKYAVDGNGDGFADINNAEDAVYAGANLLAQAGAASGDIDSALFTYNHAAWYVAKVKAVAASIED